MAVISPLLSPFLSPLAFCHLISAPLSSPLLYFRLLCIWGLLLFSFSSTSYYSISIPSSAELLVGTPGKPNLPSDWPIFATMFTDHQSILLFFIFIAKCATQDHFHPIIIILDLLLYSDDVWQTVRAAKLQIISLLCFITTSSLTHFPYHLFIFMSFYFSCPLSPIYLQLSYPLISSHILSYFFLSYPILYLS